MLGSSFSCNVCGAENLFQPEGDWRESPSCINCHSSVRMRSIHRLPYRWFVRQVTDTA